MSAIALAVIGVSVAFLRDTTATVGVASAVGVLLLAAVLKGTSPGGREESREFERRTRRAGDHINAKAPEEPSLADAAEALDRTRRGKG